MSSIDWAILIGIIVIPLIVYLSIRATLQHFDPVEYISVYDDLSNMIITETAAIFQTPVTEVQVEQTSLHFKPFTLSLFYGDWLVRYYIKRHKIFYTISSYSTGISVSDEFKYKKFFVATDFAAKVSETFAELDKPAQANYDVVEKGEEIADSKLTNEELMLALVAMLNKGARTEGADFPLISTVYGFLFRHHEEELTETILKTMPEEQQAEIRKQLEEAK